MTRFFDAEVRPPRGGWSFPIAGELVTRHSESEIIEELRKWRRQNGTFVSDDALSEEVWNYWCRQQPERCGQTASASDSGPLEAGPLIVAEKTPALQGPPIWTFLNTLAAQWSPSLHRYFLETCDAITVILDCPDCRKEWRSLLSRFSPAGLNSRLSVCQWVNMVHNQVNARKGKQQFPYARMVTEFGAPLP